jgi:hypothetical protein
LLTAQHQFIATLSSGLAIKPASLGLSFKMFRFLRQKRAVLSLSRLPLGLEAQMKRGDIKNIQPVRFLKRPMTLKFVLLAL